MTLIDVTIMTLDRTYPATMDADAISVLARMAKYTYVELNCGSKYHLKETPKEILKRIAETGKKGAKK